MNFCSKTYDFCSKKVFVGHAVKKNPHDYDANQNPHDYDAWDAFSDAWDAFTFTFIFSDGIEYVNDDESFTHHANDDRINSINAHYCSKDHQVKNHHTHGHVHAHARTILIFIFTLSAFSDVTANVTCRISASSDAFIFIANCVFIFNASGSFMSSVNDVFTSSVNDVFTSSANHVNPVSFSQSTHPHITTLINLLNSHSDGFRQFLPPPHSH